MPIEWNVPNELGAVLTVSNTQVQIPAAVVSICNPTQVQSINQSVYSFKEQDKKARRALAFAQST